MSAHFFGRSSGWNPTSWRSLSLRAPLHDGAHRGERQPTKGRFREPGPGTRSEARNPIRNTSAMSNPSNQPSTEQTAEPRITSYGSAATALAGSGARTGNRARTGARPSPRSASLPPQRGAGSSGRHRSIPARPDRCRARAAQIPQRRTALRENTPPWTVRLEHRFQGKLINVSRSGLAIELREAPPFYRSGRLRVDVRGEPVDLRVSVQWCRLVGLEQVETERGVETATRFQAGLGCVDPALRRLGAPPACGGE